MDRKNLEELNNLALTKRNVEEERKRKLDEFNQKSKEEERIFKSKFNNFKNKVLIPFAKEAKKALSSAGIRIEHYSNEEAKDISDQIKVFFKIDYFSKNYNNRYPYYICFEGKISWNTIEVVKKNRYDNDHTTIKVAELKIDEINETEVEEMLMEFIRNIGKE